MKPFDSSTLLTLSLVHFSCPNNNNNDTAHPIHLMAESCVKIPTLGRVDFFDKLLMVARFRKNKCKREFDEAEKKGESV
jgi:hypothetical protein